MNRDEGICEAPMIGVRRQGIDAVGGEGTMISTVSPRETWVPRTLRIHEFSVAEPDVYAKPRGEVSQVRLLTGAYLAAWAQEHARGPFETLTRAEWDWVADRVRSKVLAAHAAAEGAVTPDQARLDAAARQRAQAARAAELRRQREALDAELAALDETPTAAVVPASVDTRRGLFGRSTTP